LPALPFFFYAVSVVTMKQNHEPVRLEGRAVIPRYIERSMPRFALIFLFVIPFLPHISLGQTLVTGTVTDAESGEPLPAANIQIDGTYRGTITNGDGRFSLRLDHIPSTLIFRFIGFESQRRTVSAGGDVQLAVALRPATYEMGEIVVTGEDPAVDIMRKVIARKKVWRAALRSYRAEAYSRITLANDTGIVSITESVTDAFWDKERGSREVVRSRRQTSNMELDAYLPAALFVKNLYDDDIEIAGYTFIGVTHPDALNRYQFTLSGSRTIDGHVVYDIAVRPKSKLTSAFVGRLSVLDGVYALLDVELTPGEAFLFPPPVKQFQVTYRQQFTNSGGDFWLPVDFRSDADLKINFQGLIVFPDIHVHQVARLTDYEVNVAVPDSLYDKNEYLTVDSSAVAADSLLSRTGTAVPLSGLEQAAYRGIDSTMTLDKAYRPRGPLSFLVKTESGDDGKRRGQRGRGTSGPLANIDFSPELWFNRVDGAHLALGAKVSLAEGVRIDGVGGYKTGPGAWTYGGGLAWSFGPSRRLELSAHYRQGIEPRYRSELNGRLSNGVDMLFGGVDYFDYYGNEKVNARLTYRLPLRSSSIALEFNDERHFDVAKNTDYRFLTSDTYAINPTITEGRLRSFKLRLALHDEDIPLPVTGRRRLVAEVEHSASGLFDSDFSFTRYALTLDWRFETFFQRRLIPNALDLRLVAATFDGTLPPQRFSIVDASGSFYKPFGALRTLEDRPYEGDRTLALYWEHNFRTVPFEILGLTGLARRGINVIVHGAHGRTWLSRHNRRALAFDPRVPSRFHHEVGFSISGLFSLFRADFTWRLDAPGFTVGLGAARIF